MSDDMINMDPDAFGAALNKALNLASDSHVCVVLLLSRKTKILFF